ncbi:hypothetical protein [Streptomyces dysideae]|nr:hypothetical protein [Streptomyces dysideae]
MKSQLSHSAEWPMPGHYNRPSGRVHRVPGAPIVDGMHLMIIASNGEAAR